jgi:hypothetical protein
LKVISDIHEKTAIKLFFYFGFNCNSSGWDYDTYLITIHKEHVYVPISINTILFQAKSKGIIQKLHRWCNINI